MRHAQRGCSLPLLLSQRTTTLLPTHIKQVGPSSPCSFFISIHSIRHNFCAPEGNRMVQGFLSCRARPAIHTRHRLTSKGRAFVTQPSVSQKKNSNEGSQHNPNPIPTHPYVFFAENTLFKGLGLNESVLAMIRRHQKTTPARIQALVGKFVVRSV